MVDSESLKGAEGEEGVYENRSAGEDEVPCNGGRASVVSKMLLIEPEPRPKALYKARAAFAGENEGRRGEKMGALGDDVGDAVEVMLSSKSLSWSHVRT